MNDRRDGERTIGWTMLRVAMIMSGAAGAALAQGKAAMDVERDSREPAPRSGLPFARGASFATLDAYLAHLETLGPIDVPWYREVSPGQYQLVGRRRPGQPERLFTRDELAARFGFARDAPVR